MKPLYYFLWGIIAGISLSIFLICTPVHGEPGGIVGFGADPAMYIEDVPGTFSSYDDAIKYANRKKWNDDVLTRLKEKYKELWEDAYDPQVGWMLANQNPKDNIYRDQWQRIGIAIKIIEKWKAKGIHGEQNGSYFVASSIPMEVK